MLHQTSPTRRVAAKVLWIAVLVLTIVSLRAPVIARPDTLDNYRAYPALLAVPVAVLLALAEIRYFSRKSDDRKAGVWPGKRLLNRDIAAGVGA